MVHSLTEVSGSTPSTAISSTRPRHTKSMSSSGHPSKSTLPPIDDNTELKARFETRSKSFSLTTAKTKANIFFFCSSSPRGPSNSPSAHSISTPEKNRFPRGTTSRSTFHGAQLRDRRSATYNGPPASPTLSHDTGALAQQRRGTSAGIISKITSKFVRRSVKKHNSFLKVALKKMDPYTSVCHQGAIEMFYISLSTRSCFVSFCIP